MMHSASKVPAAMTGIAMAAAAAGAAQRRRAVRRTAARRETALDHMAESVCRTMLG